MNEYKQELPIGYQSPDPYKNHPANIMYEKWIETEAKLSCEHYPGSIMRGTRYFCALCRYEFTERYIKEKLEGK